MTSTSSTVNVARAVVEEFHGRAGGLQLLLWRTELDIDGVE